MNPDAELAVLTKMRLSLQGVLLLAEAMEEDIVAIRKNYSAAVEVERTWDRLLRASAVASQKFLAISQATQGTH